VEVTVPGSGPLPGTQILASYPGNRMLDGLTRAQLVGALQGLLYNANDLVDAQAEVGDDGVVELRLVRDPVHATGTWSGPARGLVADLAAEDPDGPGRVVFVRDAGRRALVRVNDVGGFGWRRIEAEAEAARVGGGADQTAPVTVSGLTTGNGLVEVTVDETDGTFSIDGQAGFGRLVDDGDAGDTYNWCPPDTDEVVDRPEQVSVEVNETGPLRARLVITAGYGWPERVRDGARVGRREARVVTTLEVRAGEALVRVTSQIDNPSRDHRLRVWFPLPEPATGSSAECAFAVVERGLTAEGGPNELGLPTFPSRRFVQAGGLTVVHEGLLEYELVDIRPASGVRGSGDDDRAHALALTLLRATGIISQGPMTSRPWPAGPPTPVEGPQMIGPLTVRYGLAVGPADPYALVDDAFVDLLVADPAKIRGMAAAPALPGDAGQALDVAGAEVSSVRRVGGRLEVRVWNPSPEPTVVSVAGRSGWQVDLRGAPVEVFEESLPLGPWRLTTLVLDE